MRNRLAISLAAALAVTGFSPAHTAPAASDAGKDSQTFYTSAIGPGLDNLSLDDDYAQYQWA